MLFWDLERRSVVCVSTEIYSYEIKHVYVRTWFFSESARRQDVVYGAKDRKQRRIGIIVSPAGEQIQRKEHLYDAL